MRANVKARQVLVAALVVAAGFGLQGRGLAGLVAGGGKKPENDCLVALRVDETGTGALSSPIKCADCDANCDQDGQAQSNKACTFKVALCVNQTSVSGCTGTALKTVVGRVIGADVKKLTAPSDLSGAPACGDPTLVTVRVKGRKTLHFGRATVTLRGVSPGKGKQRRIDADRVVLECDPSPAQTCPTTTTTTTTLPCDCCASHPSLLKFATTMGTGNCGMLQDSSGNKLEDLTCSGLYFGGKGVAVPLPGSVPDMGLAFTKITACNAATGEVTVTGSSAAETGSIRTCTSGGGHCAISTCETTTGVCTSPAGVCTAGTCSAGLEGVLCTADSDCDIPCLHDTDCGVCDVGNVGAHCRGNAACGCLFGAPLPVPNATVPAASTCVVNAVAQSASGTGTCVGDASVTLPLNSEVFLPGGGDNLPKRCSASTTQSDGPPATGPGFRCIQNVNCPGGTCVNDPAIQPCPICNPTTNKCNGGPNQGAPCTPGDSASLGSAYPTSHDCPPDVLADIGPLPISFALTTGTASKDAFQTGQGISKVRVFCPFCRNPTTLTFENPPRPCTADGPAGGCTTASFSSCEQSQSGAFTFALGAHIEETGAPAGCMADGAPHPSTLASVFCIPPSYNQTVDQNGDLPGPGAIALPGMAQLVTSISVTTTSTVTSTTGGPTTTTSSTSTTTISVSTTTTTTVATTTTTMGTTPCCGFPGGPTKIRFENITGTGSVSGSQYHVGTGNIALLKSGLYFGGAGETVPLPSTVPDKGVSYSGTTCSGTTTLTLSPLDKTQVPDGGIRRCTSPTGTCTAAASGTCDTTIFTCTGSGICTASVCTRGLVGLSCTTGADCDFACGNDHDCDMCTAGNVGAHCNTTKGGDHQCSCLFGPPLPIVNAMVPNASTCVINTVGNRFNTTVSGSGDCVQGSSSVSLPLNSEVYLTADLLPKRCSGKCSGGSRNGLACSTDDTNATSGCPGATCPGCCVGLATAGTLCTTNTNCAPGLCANDPSVQPCPICNSTTNKCNGGPNEGASCTPADSALAGHPEYPTSHDCPPPHVGAEIGGLPIPFSLTTGTASKTAFSTGAGNGKSMIFCGLCKDPLGGFQNPPTPGTGCTSDAQCTTAPFTSCEQNLNGAFGHADADSITEVGEAAGDITDGAQHSSTLVSVFCIPPAYDSTTDTNGGLPGPGAVSLPGMAQLLP